MPVGTLEFCTFGVADNRYAVLRLNIIWPSTYYHSRVVAYQNCITVLLDWTYLCRRLIV